MALGNQSIWYGAQPLRAELTFCRAYGAKPRFLLCLTLTGLG